MIWHIALQVTVFAFLAGTLAAFPIAARSLWGQR